MHRTTTAYVCLVCLFFQPPVMSTMIIRHNKGVDKTVHKAHNMITLSSSNRSSGVSDKESQK